MSKRLEIRLRRVQPDRKVKKRPTVDLTNSTKFDMIGDWISNYGMTGENLTRWIFSYLDFSSIQKGRLVCRTWCRYLINDRILWHGILMKSKIYLEMFFNKMSPDKYNLTSTLFKEFTHYFFMCIENKKNLLDYDQIFKLFGKIQSIIVIVGSHNQGSEKLNDLKYNVVGKSLYQEIVVKLISGNYPFYNRLNSKFCQIGLLKTHIRHLKEELRDADNYALFSDGFLQHFKFSIQRSIQIEQQKIQKLFISIARALEDLCNVEF